MKTTPSQKLLACALALCLVLPATLSGCANGSPEDLEPFSRGEGRNFADVASDLQQKYEDSQDVKYSEGMTLVERDHEFLIELDFCPLDMEFEMYNEIASLYYDIELTRPVSSNYDWVDEEKKSYIISPWEYPDAAVTAYDDYIDERDYPFGLSSDSYRLFDKGPYADWGNIGTMYLATKVDKTTGELLDKPEIQVITVKGELDSPRLSVEVTDEGVVRLSWNEIKGAEAYYIIQLSRRDGTISSHTDASRIGTTTDLEWQSKSQTDRVKDAVYDANKDFRTFKISEDDWLDPFYAEGYSIDRLNYETLEWEETEWFYPEDGVVADETKSLYEFAVMAVNETGSSMLSNIIDINDVASIAAYAPANFKNKESENLSVYGTISGISNIPAYQWVILCNGTLSQRVVIYDVAAAKEETEKWGNFDDDTGEYLGPVMVDVLKLPYQVEGTAFTGTLVIDEYDKEDVKAQLAEIKARQEALSQKTGNVKREIEDEGDESGVPDDLPDETGIYIDDTLVTASCALSEYLALNMLSGTRKIDLTPFPEAIDKSYLSNAWSEAFYQNPLILGVSYVEISRDGKTLYIEYEDDQKTREKKQTEIKEVIAEVVPKIINSSMTARDKEYAINQYLCDTVEYDEAALANAEENDFMTVDPEFYDSFTAYGALINGVGVCASYSAAFKLLADAAGLDCVVVTGYLNGSLGHAWNRVDLGGGRWATVDSTNNDSDLMPNAVMNVPDSAMATSLVEDSVWIMSSVKGQYNNEDDADEYYRVEGLYYEQDEVVKEIVNQLATSSLVVVRTDYMLSEDQFYSICEEVFETAKKDIGAIYWAGVIVITTDTSLFNE